jgi:HAE1 family hydrophobic/amphiphilic exporter-1
VVGGLIVSQLLTLYITPVYYVYIENARLWVTRRRLKTVRGNVEEPGTAPAVAMEAR